MLADLLIEGAARDAKSICRRLHLAVARVQGRTNKFGFDQIELLRKRDRLVLTSFDQSTQATALSAKTQHMAFGDIAQFTDVAAPIVSQQAAGVIGRYRRRTA